MMFQVKFQNTENISLILQIGVSVGMHSGIHFLASREAKKLNSPYRKGLCGDIF